jgi:hypothetical protein
MSPADKMNRLLLAARTPFVDAAVRIVTYGLGRSVLTNCQVGIAPFAWRAVTAIYEALEHVDSARVGRRWSRQLEPEPRVRAVADRRSSLRHRSWTFCADSGGATKRGGEANGRD